MELLHTPLIYLPKYIIVGFISLGIVLLFLKGRHTQSAAVGLSYYFCTVVTGSSVWGFFTYAGMHAPCFEDPVFLLKNESASQFIKSSLLIAAPFLALACHFFFATVRDFASGWGIRRNRPIVVFCVMVMCAGLYVPLCLANMWNEWVRTELPQIVAIRQATYELSDEQTLNWVNERPNDWQVILLRANFLSDVGRTEEANALYTKALRLIRDDETMLSRDRSLLIEQSLMREQLRLEKEKQQ